MSEKNENGKRRDSWEQPEEKKIKLEKKNIQGSQRTHSKGLKRKDDLEYPKVKKYQKRHSRRRGEDEEITPEIDDVLEHLIPLRRPPTPQPSTSQMFFPVTRNTNPWFEKEIPTRIPEPCLTDDGPTNSSSSSSSSDSDTIPDIYSDDEEYEVDEYAEEDRPQSRRKFPISGPAIELLDKDHEKKRDKFAVKISPEDSRGLFNIDGAFKKLLVTKENVEVDNEPYTSCAGETKPEDFVPVSIPPSVSAIASTSASVAPSVSSRPRPTLSVLPTFTAAAIPDVLQNLPLADASANYWLRKQSLKISDECGNLREVPVTYMENTRKIYAYDEFDNKLYCLGHDLDWRGLLAASCGSFKESFPLQELGDLAGDEPFE